jgi:hypothetical protein
MVSDATEPYQERASDIKGQWLSDTVHMWR